MQLVEAIHARTTVHSYAPEPVADGVVDRVLAAAHQAPCHKLTWPWRFVVVGPSTRARLLPAAFRLAELKCKGALSPKLEARVRAKLLDPAVLIVVCQRRSDDPMRSREDYAAVSCAIQNMMLVATDAGLGSKWSTGGITQDPEAWSVLGVDGTHEDVVGFVWVGVPAKRGRIERPALVDHITRLP